MNGKITISRNLSYGDPMPIHIEIEDEDSNIHFLRVDLTLENFANAITGLGYVDCQFELRGTELVGKLRENKEEIVPIPDGFLMDKNTDAKTLLAPFEIDGWIGYADDLRNSHRRVRNSNAQRVSFVRYVDKKKGE